MPIMFRKDQNLANAITMTRIFGVGFIFWLTPFSTNITQLSVVIIYTVICLTDFLDGWVARRYNIVTDMGKVLDPLADKILVLVFLPLLSMQVITAFPVFIILAREFSIMGLRVFAAKHDIIISANWAGKLKTSVTLPVCGILFARVPVEQVANLPTALQPLNWLAIWVHSWPPIVYESLIWLMVALTIWSFCDYLAKFLWQRALQKTDQDIPKAKKIIYAIIPNAISFINFFCGVLALYFGFTNIKLAGALILTGIFLDAIDGNIARKLGVFTKFGEKLDSKADFVTFGVAPSIVAFTVISNSSLPYSAILGLILGFIFYASVHFRLNRFEKGGHSDYFDGLPSPAGAGLLVMAANSMFLSQPIYFGGIVIVCALLMASTFPYPHNRISHEKMGYRFLRNPTLFFWFVTIGFLYGVPLPVAWHIPDILFGLTSLYLIAPLVPMRKEFRNT